MNASLHCPFKRMPAYHNFKTTFAEAQSNTFRY